MGSSIAIKLREIWFHIALKHEFQNEYFDSVIIQRLVLFLSMNYKFKEVLLFIQPTVLFEVIISSDCEIKESFVFPSIFFLLQPIQLFKNNYCVIFFCQASSLFFFIFFAFFFCEALESEVHLQMFITHSNGFNLLLCLVSWSMVSTYFLTLDKIFEVYISI